MFLRGFCSRAGLVDKCVRSSTGGRWESLAFRERGGGPRIKGAGRDQVDGPGGGSARPRRVGWSFGMAARTNGSGQIILLKRNDDHWTLEEELAGLQEPTQVGQVLRALATQPIFALSPQVILSRSR